MPSQEQTKTDQNELINKALNDIEKTLFESNVNGAVVAFVQSKENPSLYKLNVSRTDIPDEDLIMHLTNICAFVMERRLGFDRSEVKAFLKGQFAKNLKRMRIPEEQIAQMLSFLN